MSLCGICAPRRTGLPVDVDGCLEPEGHNSNHRYVVDGREVEWDTDHACACPSCRMEKPDNWCITYTIKPAGPAKEAK